MDILSHAGWGVAALRWRRSAALWPAAVAGMAPDLLFFLPWRAELLLRKGWAGLRVEGMDTPGIWLPQLGCADSHTVLAVEKVSPPSRNEVLKRRKA